MDWHNVPGKFPEAHYEIDVAWSFLENWLTSMDERVAHEDEEWTGGLELDPDYQRSHVWTESQQRAFVEYSLKGGEGGRLLYWNSIGWGQVFTQRVELVDGKQRLEAVRKFIRGDLTVFGGHRLENARSLGLDFRFRMRIAGLPTRADVLRWYLSINAGGTPHTEEELDRVRNLLEAEEEGS
jgi:hypothetical protein